MDDLKDQSAVSTTATNGVVESEEVRAQEALLGDTDPSLTSADDVAKALNVDPSHGLSEEEAKRRLAKFGPNELASAPPVPKWKKFLAQFQDPLVYLLIAATIISVIAWFIEKANAQPGAEGGEVLPFDAIVIILILIVNAVLGYMQEAKAEAAVEALAQMTAPQTSVLRDGKVMRINTADVVPGDIIVLAEGDSVSADGRLVNAASLRIAEASLTGESVPVGKKPDTLTEAKALGDRANMIFNGTSVTQGTGRAIVTGTGMNTQVGKIADMLSATEDEKTPLQKEMDYVSKILGIAVCVIAVVVLVALAVLEGFNDVHDVIDSLLLAVSLAVAAVPEGLAAILTVVLALGVQRMAAHNAIVKKLHSVETLGSASVICSDKTGTLTRNEMTVERVVTPSGEVQITGTGYAPEGRMVMTGGVSPESEQAQIVADEVVATLVAGTLANDGELREENGRWEIVGDPTEVSLIVAARKVKADRKIKRYTRVGEIPFTSERKRMSIIAKDSTDSDKLTVFAKGAPDVLLSYCTRIRVGGQVRKLTEGDRQSILATVERLSSEAYRTLGEACRPLETGSLADVPGVSVNAAGQVSDIADQAEAIETDLIWNGMVGIIDPPRTEVRDSVTEAHRAGIRTVMITGDHPLTAARIASDLGIIAKDGKALTGDQLDQLPDEAALDKANQTKASTADAKTAAEQAQQAAKAEAAETAKILTDATAKSQRAQTAYDQAKTALDKAQADYSTADTARQAAQTVYDEAKTANDQAQTNLNERPGQARTGPEGREGHRRGQGRPVRRRQGPVGSRRRQAGPRRRPGQTRRREDHAGQSEERLRQGPGRIGRRDQERGRQERFQDRRRLRPADRAGRPEGQREGHVERRRQGRSGHGVHRREHERHAPRSRGSHRHRLDHARHEAPPHGRDRTPRHALTQFPLQTNRRPEQDDGNPYDGFRNSRSGRSPFPRSCITDAPRNGRLTKKQTGRRKNGHDSAHPHPRDGIGRGACGDNAAQESTIPAQGG